MFETARLRLRLVTEADAPFYLDLVNQPSFYRFIGDRGIRTVDAAREAILAGPVAMQATHGFSLYLAVDKASGAPAGLCGLIRRDSLPGVDVGYAFLPAYWGTGLATEAVSATIEHARTTIGLARLLAITSPDNAASIRVLEKLGFTFERVAQLTPEGGDTNIYMLNLLVE
ncbi:MAG: GNAT family N-acetyltransferase [Pseudomonadota bacterium]